MSNRQLVVGLGNVGADFTRTRHNVGWCLVDSLASKLGATWSTKARLRGEIAETATTIFLKPTTMMNCSGEAVRAVLDFYKIPVASLLVIHDEWGLEIGEIKMKAGGSAGGHNGLRSIIAQLSSDEWARVRVGVRPAGIPRQCDPLDFVLQNFSRADSEILEKEVTPAVQTLVENWLHRQTQ